MMREVRGVWLRWVLLLALLAVGGWRIPSSCICCSMAVTLSFFLLADFLFTISAGTFETGASLLVKLLGHQGCVHCEGPISLGLQVRCCEFCKVDLE
jgi:hypothetical protein